MNRQGDQNYFPRSYSEIDCSDSKLIEEERCSYIRERRERQQQDMPSADNLSGLSLSGGGIRSASFCLGVMQALADHHILERIDYLSTVSGGGYIGSSLTWALHRDWEQGKWRGKAFQPDKGKPQVRYGVKADNFPFGTALRDANTDTEEQKQQTRGPDRGFAKMDGAGARGAAMLRYLRQHGKYLTPGNGINILSLFGVIFRGMFISLLVFVPWLVLLLYPIATNEWAGYRINGGMPPLALIAAGTIGAFLLLATLYAIMSRFSDTIRHTRPTSTETGGGTLFDERFWYRMRRGYERIMPLLLGFTGILLFLAFLPDLDHLLSLSRYMEYDELGDAGGISALLTSAAGAMTAVASFFKSNKKDQGKISSGLLVMVASLLITIGIFLLSYKMAAIIANKSHFDYLLITVIATSAIGIMANLNYLSIHRYYRDRLMESFMPNVSRVLASAPGAAQASHMADVGALCEMQSDDRAIGPYHLINTNVILVESGINKFRSRGGDSFLLSPKFCGSTATGWLRTTHFSGGKLSLATAMAISGAAANPNTGSGGQGATRQPMLSRLMTLLNLGLGVWVRNPAKPAPTWWPLPTNFLTPGSWPLVPWTKLNEKHGYLQLTDGGHFDNTGVYELIRRRVRLIIACDGGADGKFEFEDLGNLFEKVRADFGVQINFGFGMNGVIPRSANPQDNNNPEQIDYAERGYICGAIEYPEANDPSEYGLLIVVKSTFIRGLPQDLIAYKKANPAFPDQPTSDQFFDEKQFEAYRVLGFNLGKQMIESCTEELNEMLPCKV